MNAYERGRYLKQGDDAVDNASSAKGAIAELVSEVERLEVEIVELRLAISDKDSEIDALKSELEGGR